MGKEMRNSIGFLVNVIAAAVLCGAAIGAPAATHSNAPSAVTEQDCRKTGGEVSALIDNRAGAPSLPAARAVFQVGIMECMEGDYNAANKHYDQAKQLLGNDRAATPDSLAKK